MYTFVCSIPSFSHFSFLISCYFCRLRRFRLRRLRFHRSCLRPFLFLNLFVIALQENLHCIHLYVLYLPFPIFFFDFLLLLSFAPVPFSPASFSPVLFASLPFPESCGSTTRELTLYTFVCSIPSFSHVLFWFPLASVVCAGSVFTGFVFVRVLSAPLPFLESFVIPGTTTRELISVLVCNTFLSIFFLHFFCFCRLRRFRFRRLRFH